MTAYRFTAFAVMIITVLVGFAYPRPNFHISSGSSYSPTPTVDWSGFAIVFTSGAVALNFHYNLPDIARPVKNKLALTKIVTSAQLTAFGFYVLLGLLCSLYFGNATEPLATLNWRTYTARHGGWGGSTSDRPFYAVMIQLFVMLFPVFDMLSVFPLVGITLGNNLYNTAPLSLKNKFTEKRGKIICCLVGTIPPVIMAAILGKQLHSKCH
jgi:hypothetical protein